MGKSITVAVSKRAIFQRVSRLLKQEGKRLIASRSSSQIKKYGSYYIVDLDQGAIVTTHVSLEDLGHRLGSLKPWEKIE